MAPEPQHSETMSGAPPSSEPAGFSADAASIPAALSRIGTVVRDEQATLERLRTALADMAQAIARAKTVADSEAAAAMLDEFEHRVDAMIELAGGSAAAAEAAAMPEPAKAEALPAEASEQAEAPAADPDQVPTVSGVVLRLGPGDEAPAATDEPAPPAEAAADQGPTVAMLTAMVEALSASIEAPAALEAPEAIEAPAAEPAALPNNAAEHETALLASFERMETRPFPPPEVGTAVIFSPRPAAEPPADIAPELPPPEPGQAAAPEPKAAAAVDPDFDPTDFLFGPEPESDPAEFSARSRTAARRLRGRSPAAAGIRLAATGAGGGRTATSHDARANRRRAAPRAARSAPRAEGHDPRGTARDLQLIQPTISR